MPVSARLISSGEPSRAQTICTRFGCLETIFKYVTSLYSISLIVLRQPSKHESVSTVASLLFSGMPMASINFYTASYRLLNWTTIVSSRALSTRQLTAPIKALLKMLSDVISSATITVLSAAASPLCIAILLFCSLPSIIASTPNPKLIFLS